MKHPTVVVVPWAPIVVVVANVCVVVVRAGGAAVVFVALTVPTTVVGVA
jgi:hypothetical protein